MQRSGFNKTEYEQAHTQTTSANAHDMHFNQFDQVDQLENSVMSQ